MYKKQLLYVIGITKERLFQLGAVHRQSPFTKILDCIHNFSHGCFHMVMEVSDLPLFLIKNIRDISSCIMTNGSRETLLFLL
jgi:hypothetical protein